MNARIFNIQRMSLHDGPGIRTTVFFKGCSLRCIWCHNPESLEEKPQLEWNPSLCSGCGACIPVCKTGARKWSEYGVTHERSLCVNCGACGDVCPTGALQLVGKEMNIMEIAREVRKDKIMYDVSGGGVTCSGGEPLLQADAVAELLKILKGQGIHTAVDTAGNVSYEAFEKVMPYTDVFLYDLKLWDSKRHKQYTGASNEKILDNFIKVERQKPIIVRIPFVAGIQEAEYQGIADFLHEKKNVRFVEILPYHRLGENKYLTLGKKIPPLQPAKKQNMQKAAEYFKSVGVSVH